MNRRGKTVAIWVGVAAAATGLALLIWQRRRRYRTKVSRRSRDDNDATTSSNSSNSSSSVEHMNSTTLLLEFQKATESSRQLKNLHNGDRLMLYGLYKQATVGDCDVSKEPPSRFNVVEHAKYEGWMKFQGMASEDAMKHYCKAIGAFTTAASGEVMEYQTEELDMYNAMGMRPSKMVDEEEKEEDDTNHTTPCQQLRLAAREGNLKKLKDALLECDAQVDATDDSGQTALHFAADRGFLEGVELLLEAGADANAADNDGIGVLQAAVIAGHFEIAHFLLQNGANADQADFDGDTPRTCALDDGSDKMRQLFTELPTIE